LIQLLLDAHVSKAKSAKSGRKVPSDKALDRAVASSTAIETGQSIAELERKLKKRGSRFANVELARK